MCRNKKKYQKLQTLETLIRQNKKNRVEIPDQCNLLGTIKVGNKQIDLYDRINTCSPVVYVASRNLPISSIKPITRKVAFILTQIPNATLKRFGSDILSASRIKR